MQLSHDAGLFVKAKYSFMCEKHDLVSLSRFGPRSVGPVYFWTVQHTFDSDVS